MYKKIIEVILPLVHAWGILLYILIIANYISRVRLFPGPAVLLILGFPIIILEILMTKYYDRKVILNLKTLTLISLRLIFLFFLITIKPTHIRLYKIIVYLMEYLIKYIIYAAYVKYRLILYFLLIFSFFYYTFVIRRRLLRFTISFILPMVFFSTFILSYYFDTNCDDLSKIIRQKDVEVIFGLKTLKEWGRSQYIQRNKSDWRYSDWRWARARDIQVDGNIIYAAYGATVNYNNSDLPCFFKLNSSTGKIQAIFKRTVRSFGIDPNSTNAYIGLWSPGEILVIDKHNLKEISSINLSSVVGRFELLNFYFDSEKNIIYIAASRVSKIVKYDIKSKKILGVLDLRKMGICGNDIWKANFRSNTNKLYFLTYGGNFSIVELDPEEFEITNLIKLPGEGTAMDFDEQKNTLLVSGFSTSKMWEVDLSTLKIIKTYDIPFGCRHIYVDPRGAKLFLLSYISGKLLVLSRESGRIEKEYLVGEKPDGLFVLENYLYVSSNAGIIRIKYQ